MAHLLAIESSGDIGSVAIFSNRELVDEILITEERSHSRLMAETIKQITSRNNLNLQSFDAIGISAGPGSYTGLRIGTSLAKGICYSLSKPLISLNTLRVLATMEFEAELVCPMIDARRMEVYAAVFDKLGNEIAPSAPMILSEDSFDQLLDKQSILFVGNGAEKASTLIRSPNAAFDPQVNARAARMGEMLYEKYVNGNFEDLLTFEPNYLKPVYTTKPKSV